MLAQKNSLAKAIKFRYESFRDINVLLNHFSSIDYSCCSIKNLTSQSLIMDLYLHCAAFTDVNWPTEAPVQGWENLR